MRGNVESILVHGSVGACDVRQKEIISDKSYLKLYIEIGTNHGYAFFIIKNNVLLIFTNLPKLAKTEDTIFHRGHTVTHRFVPTYSEYELITENTVLLFSFDYLVSDF